MKLNKVIYACAAAAIAMGATTAMAEEPLFMRSSIYTILVNSDEQNTRLDKEAQETDAQGYAEAVKSVPGGQLGSIPKTVFPGIKIPEQFNDHNLDIRVLDFDKLTAGMTDADAKEAKPEGKKGGGFGKFMKSAASTTVASASGQSESSMLRVEKVDDYMHAAVKKFLQDNKVADMMVAKWYNYNPEGTPRFNDQLIAERGLDNASATELAKASANDILKAKLSAQGFDLINNTFVVATNLRFRNNKALAKEIAELTGGVASTVGSQFGAVGTLAAFGAKKAAQAAANGLMKDQYSVTAVTYLYKLDWNDDLDQELGSKIFYNNDATLDDLINLGVCKLTYVGESKARSGVKKNKEKTLDQLAATASERAIDKALAKLQVDNEVFRTKVPISKSDGEFVYAKIGSKEGVMAGDEYEVLEMVFNEKSGKNELKKVSSAVVEKNGVWFNTTGADELIATAEDKEAEQMKAAQELGYTKFKAKKKGDLSGYYLRLAKKKGKIED